MAYQTATGIVGLYNVLDALADFAEANAGYTRQADVTTSLPAASTTDMVVIKHDTSAMYTYFMGMEATDGEYGDYGYIAMRMSKVAPTGSNWEDTTINAQKGITQTFTYDKRGSDTYTNYYMFTDSGSSAVHCAIEVSANIFAHISFGIITKYGTWTGGDYLTGSDLNIASAYSVSSFIAMNNSYHYFVFGGRVTPDGSEDTGYLYHPYESKGTKEDFASFRYGNLIEDRRVLPAACVNESYGVTGDLFEDCSPNAYNDRSKMFPIYLRSYDNRATVGTQKYLLVGHVPGARIIECSDIAPKTLVDTNWMVFPQYMRSESASDAPVSGSHGVAYQKIT